MSSDIFPAIETMHFKQFAYVASAGIVGCAMHNSHEGLWVYELFKMAWPYFFYLFREITIRSEKKIKRFEK